MFASAGGGGKRIGSNKQNQQQQSQIQTHQHPTHPQPHQLLQQHQAQQQQQQLQNNPLLHHNRQTPPQSATNSHPLQHSHTQQQQQSQQQTVIVQHQQKPSPVAHQPQQFQPHHQFPVTFLSCPFGNVHAAAAAGQHRPVGTNSQIPPSPTSLVCTSNETINGNRPAASISTTIPHYMQQTTNSQLMTPGYHLQVQQNSSVMVASQYNNVAATAAGTGASQLTNSSAGGPAFYQTRQQTRTPPSQQQQQQALINTQHALQYFQNSTVPIHQLQHHPPQQIRNMNMIAMVTPQPRQPFIMPPSFFTLAPQTLTAAPPPTSGYSTRSAICGSKQSFDYYSNSECTSKKRTSNGAYRIRGTHRIVRLPFNRVFWPDFVKHATSRCVGEQHAIQS